MARKTVIKRETKVKIYPLLSDQIDLAIERAWRRAHKHTDTPDEDVVKEAMQIDVMETLCEFFDFGD